MTLEYDPREPGRKWGGAQQHVHQVELEDPMRANMTSKRADTAANMRDGRESCDTPIDPHNVGERGTERGVASFIHACLTTLLVRLALRPGQPTRDGRTRAARRATADRTPVAARLSAYLH